MKNIFVADIMTRDPVKVAPTTSLFDCAKTLVKKKTGSLLLVDKKRLVGFITSDDILWALVKKSKQDLSQIRAIDISPRKIATVKPTATVEEAISKMKKLKFRRLPVIHNGELVGIVTARDIFSFNPQIYSEFSEIEQVKEESEKLNRIKKAKDREYMHNGICEECGNQGILYKVDDRVICESCRSLM